MARGWIGACVVLWGALASGAGAAEPLRSPWRGSDAAGAGAGAGAAAACPAAPALPGALDMADYYSDGRFSVIDPARQAAYGAAVRPLHAATLALERMADGGQGACALAWLRAFAAAGVLTGRAATNQGEYVRGWMLGAWAAVALKAGPGGVPGPVASWLAGLGEDVQRYFDGRAAKTDGRNNHRNWAGFAAAAAGVAAGRADLFGWGVASARAGLRQVQADGTLPLEMARGSRALHYHLFATAPLVLTAELAAANGIDLYAAPDAAGQAGALRRLAVRALSGLADPGWFAARAGAAQVGFGGDRPGDVGWAATFLARCPDAAARPAAAGRGDLYSGGLPPGPVTAAP